VLLPLGHGSRSPGHLSGYFDSIPHADLLKSVARRIVVPFSSVSSTGTTAGVEQLVDMPHGVQRAAVWPIGVLLRLQVGLENRFEHQKMAVFAGDVVQNPLHSPNGENAARPN
jgi:hypothetical protein